MGQPLKIAAATGLCIGLGNGCFYVDESLGTNTQGALDSIRSRADLDDKGEELGSERRDIEYIVSSYWGITQHITYHANTRIIRFISILPAEEVRDGCQKDGIVTGGEAGAIESDQSSDKLSARLTEANAPFAPPCQNESIDADSYGSPHYSRAHLSESEEAALFSALKHLRIKRNPKARNDCQVEDGTSTFLSIGSKEWLARPDANLCPVTYLGFGPVESVLLRAATQAEQKLEDVQLKDELRDGQDFELIMESASQTLRFAVSSADKSLLAEVSGEHSRSDTFSLSNQDFETMLGDLREKTLPYIDAVKNCKNDGVTFTLKIGDQQFFGEPSACKDTVGGLDQIGHYLADMADGIIYTRSSFFDFSNVGFPMDRIMEDQVSRDLNRFFLDAHEKYDNSAGEETFVFKTEFRLSGSTISDPSIMEPKSNSIAIHCDRDDIPTIKAEFSGFFEQEAAKLKSASLDYQYDFSLEIRPAREGSESFWRIAMSEILSARSDRGTTDKEG